MSNQLPLPNPSDDALRSLLREKLNGDDNAVRCVESLIRELRAEQWNQSPPPSGHRRVPHS